MVSFKSELRIHLSMVVLTAVIFPLIVLIIGLFFPTSAGGEPVYVNGKITGFASIGQQFRTPGYFYGRPSASGYNGSGSYGSNLSPADTALTRIIREREAELRKDGDGPVPEDLLTASASGLDPDISVEAAVYQIKRVSRVRNLPQEKVMQLVIENVEPVVPLSNGRKMVNVLKLNLALDSISERR